MTANRVCKRWIKKTGRTHVKLSIVDGYPPKASVPQECSSEDTDRESARSTPKNATGAPHPEKPKGTGSSRRGRKPTKTDAKGDKSKREAANNDTPLPQEHSDVILKQQEAQPANKNAINIGEVQRVASGEQCPQTTGTDMIDPPVPLNVEDTPLQTTPTQNTNACNQKRAADVAQQPSKEKEKVQNEALQDMETAKDGERKSRGYKRCYIMSSSYLPHIRTQGSDAD